MAPVDVGDIGNQQVFLEAFGAGEEPPLRVESRAAAVEDQVVVAAHLVHHHQRQAVFLGDVAEHLLAQHLFPHGERRSGEVDNGLGAGSGKNLDGIVVVAAALPEIAVVPDVFADADPQLAAIQLQDLRLRGRLEVAVFVEDVVGGQQRLVEDRPGLAVSQQHGAVEQGPAHLGGVHGGDAHQQRRPVRQLGGHALELVAAPADKTAAHQQIARQVPHESQLRRDHQVGAQHAGLPGPADDQRGVAGYISSGRVGLQECDAQRFQFSNPADSGLLLRTFLHNREGMDPLVTIVTPSYNTARYLPETIASVLSQDYSRIEYIVVDGGSTDETLALLENYRGRLRFITGKDKGPSDAIHRGFSQAKGEILAWINADDTYLPGAVRTGVEFLEAHTEIDVVYGEGYWVDENGGRIDRYPTLPFDEKNAGARLLHLPAGVVLPGVGLPA